MSKVFVVGAGTIGLRTALELTKRTRTSTIASVTLRAPHHPFRCSTGAAGLWMPVHSPDPRTSAWALETLDELWNMAAATEEKKNDGASDSQQRPLVEQLMAVILKRDHSGPTLQDYMDHPPEQLLPNPTTTSTSNRIPSWATDPRLEFQHLTVEMLAWQNLAFQLRLPTETDLIHAGYKYAWMFRTLVVDAPRMLEHMLQELSTRDNVEVDVADTNYEYESLDDMIQAAADAGCDTLVNCTGMGAARLCDDDQLVGGRGILHLYDRATARRRPDVLTSPYGAHAKDAVIMTDEAPWATDTMPCYLIPRGDVLVVGGSMLKGDTESSIRDDERAQLVQNAQRLGIDTTASEPISEWIGYRPYRPTIRVEVDDAYAKCGVKVVHNYGHGGSGWTINVGCARECADLITGPVIQ